MPRSAYREHDLAFGQTMLTLRTALGLTQLALARHLGVSRRSVGEWEAGSKYPNVHHVRAFILLAVQQRAFQAGQEAEEIRALWKAAHIKARLDESWLQAILGSHAAQEILTTFAFPADAPSTERGRESLRNLPFQATSFIGREMHVATVAMLLKGDACRLLTLIGPGGIGKTRLALHVAEAEVPGFEDGVVFVPLASLGMPQQIVPAIGDALKLNYGGQSDPAGYILGALGERAMLIVLDNFEHLLDGAPLVLDILMHAPHVKVLVTSRERLNLQAEFLFEVPGLTFPDEREPNLDGAPLTPHSPLMMGIYTAVQLFLQRAAQVQVNFAPTQVEFNIIGNICRSLAGMPLAIELAAASVRVLSVAEIERRIHINLDVLATSLRDLPERHRSLRAAFDQSWNLLVEQERALFSRMAIFQGGCTTDAAEQVARATVPALTTLVDKSLMRQQTDHVDTREGIGDETVPTSEPRFVMLEPLREYGLAQLAARGDLGELQRRHALYFVALAEAADAQWESASDALIVQLVREYDNIRAALLWARDGGDVTLGLRLCVALRKYWQRRGYYREGRMWLDVLLAVEKPDLDDADRMARLRGLHTAAWLASDQHDYARASELFDRSMHLRRALGDAAEEANVLAPTARQARAMGQYGHAIELLRDVLARQRAQGDRRSFSAGGLGLALYELGLALREQGDFAQALELFEECLQLHRDLGDREGVTVGLLGLADLARDQGERAGMRQYGEQSLAIAGDLGVEWARGFALNNLALAAYLDGDLAQAADLIGRSMAVFRASQADSSLAEVLITESHILNARGETDKAHAAMTEALRLAQALGPRLLVAATLEGMARFLAQRGDLERAVRLSAAATLLREQMGTPARPLDHLLDPEALTSARSRLGDAAFDALWQAGREMPLDEMLAAILDSSSPSTPS